MFSFLHILFSFLFGIETTPEPSSISKNLENKLEIRIYLFFFQTVTLCLKYFYNVSDFELKFLHRSDFEKNFYNFTVSELIFLLKVSFWKKYVLKTTCFDLFHPRKTKKNAV